MPAARMVKLCPGRAKKSRPYGLLAPGTVSALAFKHADRFAGKGVEYATDEIELGVTLHAPAVFSGLFGKFFAAEIHVSPLHERGNKHQTTQTFPYSLLDGTIFVVPGPRNCCAATF